MAKLYLMLIVLGILGSVGAGVIWYYNDTQERIATLQENNAKLETALVTSEASIETLKNDIVKFQELNSQLQADLQAAEAYGDELRQKLRTHDLTDLAKRKPGLLEGKMNGATANLWRDLEKDTGATDNDPLPHWLQRPTVDEPARAGSENSNTGGENNGAGNSETEADPTS